MQINPILEQIREICSTSKYEVAFCPHPLPSLITLNTTFPILHNFPGPALDLQSAKVITDILASRMASTRNSCIRLVATFLATCFAAVLIATPTFQSHVVPDSANEGIKNVSDPTLPELYNQLVALFDEEAIEEFFRMKNQTDPDAAQLMLDIDKYLREADANFIVASFWNDPEFVDAVHYLYLNGLTNIYQKINQVHQKYGYELVSPPGQNSPKTLLLEFSEPKFLNITNRAPELLQEFLDFLDLERVRLFFHQVYEAPALQNLYARFSDQEFGAHYREFKKLPALTRLGDSLTWAGFELNTLTKIVEVCMRWENHTSVGLRQELENIHSPQVFQLGSSI